MTTAPDQHLSRITRQFPKFWQHFERMRELRGRSLPDWPSWCYCPLAGAYSVVRTGWGLTPYEASLIGQVGCLAAWRPTRGIYRFDPDFAQELLATPFEGDLPIELLYRLPEWCVYITISDSEAPSVVLPMRGFFAYLEHDANDGHGELRLYVDVNERELLPLGLDLIEGGLQASIASFIGEATRRAALAGWTSVRMSDFQVHRLEQYAAPLLSLLLYLCAEEPDYGGRESPRHPRSRRRVTGAQGTTEWNVGFRIGHCMRNQQVASPPTADGLPPEEGEPQSTHASPRPHIRRAHWHTYRTGPGRQELKLKWLSPMLVGGSGIVTTEHVVKDG